METIIEIKGMHCNSCKMLIEDVCNEIEGVYSCSVDLAKENAIINHNEKTNLKLRGGDKMKGNNSTWIITLIVVLLVLLFFGSFGMFGFGTYGMINPMFGSGFGFMWIFMLLVPILIIIALILFIAWLVKQLQFSGGKK